MQSLFPVSWRQFVRRNFWIILILAAGVGLRVWNITWGLPELNEEAFPLSTSLGFWNWGKSGFDFNPHFFHYPGLTFYLNFMLQAVVYGAGYFLGFFKSLQDFGAQMSTMILLSRGLTVAFDAGTVILLSVIGKRLWSQPVGLVAAIFFAVNPLGIKEAHLINVDIPLTFFATLSAYFILRLFETDEAKWFLLAGVSIGAAAASKYNGALLLVVLAAASMLRARTFSDALRSLTRMRLLFALLGALVVFLMFNPYILLSFGEFWKDISYERYHMSHGHLGLDTSQGTAAFYLVNALPSAFGWIAYAVILASAILLVWKRRRKNILILLFPVLYLGVILTWEMRADRYILPVIPFLSLIGAIGLWRAWEDMRRRIVPAGLSRAAASGAVCLIAFSPVREVMRYQASFSLPDTRTMAKDWLMKTLPRGSAYVTGPFGIKTPVGYFSVVNIPFTPTGSEALTPFYDTRWYEDLDLLITSDYDYGRFLQEPERFHQILGFYEKVHYEWTHVLDIPSAGGETQGPSFWFYRPPPGEKSARFDEDLLASILTISEASVLVNFAERLGYALFASGKLEKSAQLVQVAFRLDPENIRIARELAWTLFKLGKFQEALPVVERSLAVDPDQAEVVGLRGSILLRLGRQEEAETILRRSLAMNGRFELAYIDLELLYRTRKDTNRAADIVKRYIQILPPGSEAEKEALDRLRQLEGGGR